MTHYRLNFNILTLVQAEETSLGRCNVRCDSQIRRPLPPRNVLNQNARPGSRSAQPHQDPQIPHGRAATTWLHPRTSGRTSVGRELEGAVRVTVADRSSQALTSPVEG